MKQKIGIVLAGICLVFFAGCMGMSDQGQHFQSEKLKQLKVGESTEADVVRLHGKPINRVSNSDGSVILIYTYMKHNDSGTHHLNQDNSLSTDAEPVHWYSESLIVTIGPDGKLKNYSQSKGP